jgi:hypothetical protein
VAFIVLGGGPVFELKEHVSLKLFFTNVDIPLVFVEAVGPDIV